MSEQVKLIAVAGSTREGSFNRKVLAIAVKGARDAGADVEVIDLAEFPMPIFNQDFEARQGHPENVKKLRQKFKESDGLLIASPEYNGAPTPLLKNTIDWLSRPSDDEPGLVAFSGKTAAIVSASPGKLGGLRSLTHLRVILSGINVFVLPRQIAVSQANEAFSEDGSLKDDKQNQAVLSLGRELAETTAQLRR